jgi:hypothetical protein
VGRISWRTQRRLGVVYTVTGLTMFQKIRNALLWASALRLYRRGKYNDAVQYMSQINTKTAKANFFAFYGLLLILNNRSDLAEKQFQIAIDIADKKIISGSYIYYFCCQYMHIMRYQASDKKLQDNLLEIRNRLDGLDYLPVPLLME